MATFILYLKLGIGHILDLHSADHMLFIIVLFATYQLRDWRRALFLLLFYIVGNLGSLSLSSYKLINPSLEVIHYLIPLTILVAALSNIFRGQVSTITRNPSRYILACIFGIIHGFGSAGYLDSIIGMNKAVFIPLIAFNLGLDLAFLIVFMIYLLISWIFVNNLGISRRDWYMVISAAIAGIAITFMFESRYWLD